MTTYVLGGGCFWCLDAAFRHLKGVQRVESGYSDGTTKDPSYYEVADGHTGHAEVVEVTFDERILPTDTLLDIYFSLHDPTTLNRQGADIGTQYRSIMLYQDETQRKAFEAARDRAAMLWEKPVVTEITLLKQCYPAEPEHQDYFSNNPDAGYCQIVIAPKVAKMHNHFKEFFQPA